MKFPLRYDERSGYILDAAGLVIAYCADHAHPPGRLVKCLNTYQTALAYISYLHTAPGAPEVDRRAAMAATANEALKDTP